MKPTDATLNATLAGRQFYTADLITITLTDGTVLNYCSGASNIVYNNSTFSAGGIGSTAGGPFWDRKDNKAKVTWKIGSQGDQLTIDVLPGAAQVENMSFMNAVRVGLFDNADFQLRRAFMTTYGTVPSTNSAVLMFQGSVGAINTDRAIATFQIDDYRQLLNQQMPKWLFAPNCQNTLYDANCTVQSSLFSSSSAAVSPGSSASFLVSTALTAASGYFDNGKISFNTGSNAGLSFAVSSWNLATTTLTLTSPIPFAPSTTDTFNAYAGCDRSTGTGGCAKFSNIANFRGMPYIPDPQTAF